MKKIFFAALFAACAATGLSACNGDYDATPNSSNGGMNPLNPPDNGGSGSGGGGASAGQITCKIDGTSYTFTGAKYSVAGSQRTISGNAVNGDNSTTITVIFSNYTGAKTYDLATAGSGGLSVFLLSNPSGTLTNYSTNSTSMPGTGTSTVSSDATNEIKGSFSFTANRIGGTNGGSQVVVTEGSFDVGP